MHFKKLLALLVSAALMLSLLAGCGNGESAVQALLKLLDGRYPNISIEIDHDLEADLRQAIRKAEAENAGDDAAVIRAALETALGSTITFRYLGDGQQGDTTFDLVFYAGSDPDKAAQAAYSQWNLVFANVPDDGKYDTALAMVETENGVWMLVKATVEKAGTPDKPDKDDDEPDEPETQEPEKDPYTDNGDNSYTINTEDGLQQLVEDLNWPVDKSILSADITLDSDVDLQGVEWEAIGVGETPYNGNFDGGNHTISNLSVKMRNWNGLDYTYSTCYGLFGYVGENGTVKNVTVSGNVNEAGRSTVGIIAGKNYGHIINCQAEGSVSGESNIGGIVGYNYGSVTGCSSAVSVTATEQYSYAGGIVGHNGASNDPSAEVVGCDFDGTVTGKYYVGGVTGSNYAEISACLAKGTISGTSFVGGLVGTNPGISKNVEGCYFTGSVIGTADYIGGAFGQNEQAQYIVECYWNGTSSSNLGVGQGKGVFSNGKANNVPNEITWEAAQTAMNGEILDTGYQFSGDSKSPVLTYS